MTQVTHIWSIIGVCSSIAIFLRVAPAIFKTLNKLNDYPRVIKFLDYTICMINGDIVYTLAFGNLPQGDLKYPVLWLTIVTLLSSLYIMIRTNCLTKSFLWGLFMLICGLCVIMPPF